MSSHWTLCLIHFLYFTFTPIIAWVQRRKRRQPRPLKTLRAKIPQHLCLNLVAGREMSIEETENVFLQCVQDVAAWCQELGIEMLTVYDRDGFLYNCSENVRRRVFAVGDGSEDSGESEIEYPLTPPLSEPSGSRSQSPEHMKLPENLNTITMTPASRVRKRRNVAVRRRTTNKSTPSNLTLHIASRASAKPAVALAGRFLLHSYVGSFSTSMDTLPGGSSYTLSVTELGTILEANLPSPDLMIIHHVERMNTPYPSIEFHGFPPWQVTLAEFHLTHPDDGDQSDCAGPRSLHRPVLVSETAFCRALDEYAGAQFRLGR